MGGSASKSNSKSPQPSQFSPIRNWATGLVLKKQPKAVTQALKSYASSRHATAADNLIYSRMQNVEEANINLANAQRRFNVDPSNSSRRNLENKQDALHLAQGRLNDQITSKPIAPGPLRRLHRRLPELNPEPAPPLSNVASSIRSSAVAPIVGSNESMPAVGGMRKNRSKSRSKKQKASATRKARKARKTQRRK
jgi:hypothetical protein